MLRIPHCLDNRLTDGGKVVSPTHPPHLTPQKHSYFYLSGTHFCYTPCYLYIDLEGQKKTMNNLSQDSQCLGQDWSRAPPKYESRTLMLFAAPCNNKDVTAKVYTDSCFTFHLDKRRPSIVSNICY
jgi:hypothetical protein